MIPALVFHTSINRFCDMMTSTLSYSITDMIPTNDTIYNCTINGAYYNNIMLNNYQISKRIGGVICTYVPMCAGHNACFTKIFFNTSNPYSVYVLNNTLQIMPQKTITCDEKAVQSSNIIIYPLFFYAIAFIFCIIVAELFPIYVAKTNRHRKMLQLQKINKIII